MSEKHLIDLTVNGVEHELLVEPRWTLLDVLRHEVGLTGTHVGCEHGVCGACTVLVDGEPVRACLMYAVQAERHAIETVESLGSPEELNDLQQAFSRHHGLQCGFCTPGFLMLAEGFLAQEPTPSRDEIREAMSANICRCTGYQTILDAVEETAARRSGTARDEPSSSPAGDHTEPETEAVR
jgi:aerobic-type carbon monoxide dehydrogenase small subunit (CoxS/CutS family)